MTQSDEERVREILKRYDSYKKFDGRKHWLRIYNYPHIIPDPYCTVGIVIGILYLLKVFLDWIH